MAVYVDPLRPTPPETVSTWRWNYPEACHLLADTLEELHRFAVRLRLRADWFHKGAIPHYDLTANKRAQALALGAVEISTRDYIRRIRAKSGPEQNRSRENV